MTAPHPFVNAVGRALEARGLRGPVVVACSGGGDSLALLRACVELRDAGSDLAPLAAHFDHRQRPDSDADGTVVAALCEAWGIGFDRGVFDGNPGASEATLRAARYGWLTAAAARISSCHVLTGHTADDQAETVLMRILRGTGVAGLAGIPADGPAPGPPHGAMESTGSEVHVVRPMLGETGAAARAFLRERGVAWREDPSNATPDFTRNRLRRDVLPRLESINPRWQAAVLRLSAQAAGDAGATDSLANAIADRAVASLTERQIELWERELAPLTDPARIAVLRIAWKRAGWPERRINAAAWGRLAALRPGQRTELPHHVRAVHATGEIVLRRGPSPAPADSDGPTAEG